MAVIDPHHGSITLSGDTGSITIRMVAGECGMIFVKAASDSTTFDVKITDQFSDDVYHVTNITGHLADLVRLPIYGNVTLTVENASVQDSVFTYNLPVTVNL